MLLADLIPSAKALSRADKARLIRLLADDLAADTSADPALPADASYPVWSPDTAFAAADILLRTLAAEGRP